MVNADDSLVNDGFYVRDYLIKNKNLLPSLTRDIENADVKIKDETNLRMYILEILYRCNQRTKEGAITFICEAHKDRLEEEYIKVEEDEE